MKLKCLLTILLVLFMLISCEERDIPEPPYIETVLPGSTETVTYETAADETSPVRDLTGEGMFAAMPDAEGAEQACFKDCGDGCYMTVYSGVPASEAERYAASLMRSGYVKIAERRDSGNLLYTLYDGTVLIHLIRTEYQRTLRVIAEPCDDVSYLKHGENSTAAEEKILSVTQIGMDYTEESGKYQSGMSYVCLLGDGSFLVIDGGYYRLTDAVRMYEFMKKKSGGEIVISAWVLTHAHSDHIGEFIKFAEFYSSLVKVEKIICNFPSAPDCAVTGDPERLDECREAMRKYPGAQVIKAHPGDIIPLYGTELEFLYTTELYFPDVLDQFNISSMIFRLSSGGKSMLFLGDMLAESGRIIRYVWGENLRSDAVQVAHHGAKGGSTDIYKLISPAYAFWPVGAEDYDNYRELPRNIFISTSPGIRSVWVARGDIITVGWDELK